MNWNTNKLNSLIQERTAEAEPLFYPTQPSGDFGNLSLEELKLSQSIHALDSTGVVGQIKRAFQNLVACMPDVSVLDKENSQQASEFIQQREDYDEALSSFRENYTDTDFDTNGEKYPVLSLVRYNGNIGIVVSDSTHEAPRMYYPRTGQVEQGHWRMRNYYQPTNEEILSTLEKVDANSLRSAVARRVSSHTLGNLDQMLQETTEDEDATEQEAVPSETQSTVSVSADSSTSSPSSSEEQDRAAVGDRPNRPWSV